MDIVRNDVRLMVFVGCGRQVFDLWVGVVYVCVCWSKAKIGYFYNIASVHCSVVTYKLIFFLYTHGLLYSKC